MNRTQIPAIGAVLALVYGAAAIAAGAATPSLNEVYATLAAKRFVE